MVRGLLAGHMVISWMPKDRARHSIQLEEKAMEGGFSPSSASSTSPTSCIRSDVQVQYPGITSSCWLAPLVPQPWLLHKTTKCIPLSSDPSISTSQDTVSSERTHLNPPWAQLGWTFVSTAKYCHGRERPGEAEGGGSERTLHLQRYR